MFPANNDERLSTELPLCTYILCAGEKVIADTDNVTAAVRNLPVQLQHLLEKTIAAKAATRWVALARLQPAPQGR